MSVPTPRPQWFFACIAGPDQGKRLALTEGTLTIGRATDSNLLSDDPDVTERFATLRLERHAVQIRGLANPLPFVDGHSRMEAVLAPGQQVRLGRSLWHVVGPGAGGEGVLGFVSRLGDHLNLVAGLEKPSDWHPGEMFSEVVKRHADEEVESYFTVGTSRTSPALADIDTRWPRPWMFVRVLLLSLLVYLGFLWIYDQFDNIRLVPGLIMTGSVAVPFALLILCFEANTPRNISLYQVIKLVLLGGLVSIVISLFFFRWTGLSSWLGAASAGIVEESGKALTLLLVVTRPRYRWTLNGLLLGAAVGTGFAVFESSGYALDAGISESVQAMKDNIMSRGILSVFGGHPLWTGLVGAALWRVRGARPFRPEMFFDPRFLRVFGLCVAMHMIWNSPLTLPAHGKYLLLGVVVWFLVLEMIQAGLKEVREAQVAEATGQHPAVATALPGTAG